MRAGFFVASLIGGAIAATITITQTTDVTITSCTSSVTDYVVSAGSESEWENASVPSAPAVTTSAEWNQWSSAAAPCPAYTATAPPEWFSMLPDSAYSSVAAEWTGGPPADWCYYSYSSTVLATATATAAAPYYPTGAPTSVVATGGYKPSTTSAYTKYTGAATSNAGSIALAGLAAAAALVLA